VNDTDWLRKAFRVPKRPGCLLLLGALAAALGLGLGLAARAGATPSPGLTLGSRSAP
jgi:hypothetical protein